MNDEIARIDDSNNLIGEPFVDSLAKIQQEKYLQKKTAKQESKKVRDKKLVAIYLKSKFPDAFDKYTMTVPERDLPRLLRLAKRKYVRRIIAATALFPISITGFSLINKFALDPLPIGIPLFLLSIAAMISGSLLMALSGKTLYDGEG